MKLDRVTERSHEILRAVAGVIVGKGDVLERILAGILASGHVLIEDYPGLAKTLIARLFAQAPRAAPISSRQARALSRSIGPSGCALNRASSNRRVSRSTARCGGTRRRSASRMNSSGVCQGAFTTRARAVARSKRR